MGERVRVALSHTHIVGTDHTGHGHGIGNKVSSLVEAISHAHKHCSDGLANVPHDHLANGLNYQNSHASHAQGGHSHSHAGNKPNDQSWSR